jgi:hypothetical protein
LPNLYLVGLASTATAKDAPLKSAKNLFVDPLGGMSHLLGSGDVSSDAAIERLVRQRPACLLPMDEIGSWLQEGSGGRSRSAITTCTVHFSPTRPRTSLTARQSVGASGRGHIHRRAAQRQAAPGE